MKLDPSFIATLSYYSKYTNNQFMFHLDKFSKLYTQTLKGVHQKAIKFIFLPYKIEISGNHQTFPLKGH